MFLASQGKNELEKSEDEAAYVIKIEPKENGPLFCEIHFYTNCSKKDECNVYIYITSLNFDLYCFSFIFDFKLCISCFLLMLINRNW